jgi:hypothetical protein
LFDGGANKYFRIFSTRKNDCFNIKSYTDLTKHNVFNVGTSYGLYWIEFSNILQSQINLTEWDNFNSDNKNNTLYIDRKSNNLVVSSLSIEDRPSLEIEANPRQGVNTCGHKELFVFTECTKFSDYCLLSNKKLKDVRIENQFVFPLINRSNIIDGSEEVHKYIILPYKLDGEILSKDKLSKYTFLNNHLMKYKHQLESRKGVMLRSLIKRGFWWAFLGVGRYSFTNYKVFWQSYGDKSMKCKIMPGKWQGDQSMHAFIPCNSIDEAKNIKIQLENPDIERYLKSLNGEGKCNWAQPSKIKSLFQNKQKLLFQ